MDAVCALKDIFAKHERERICVLGTTCCGKSTLQEKIPGTVDMDEVLWPLLSQQEEARICQKPWTSEVGAYAADLVRARLAIEPGHPFFSLIFLECEVLVLLDIQDDVLRRHCAMRGASFEDAKNVRDAIEGMVCRRREKGGILFYTVAVEE